MKILNYSLVLSGMLALATACSEKEEPKATITIPTSETASMVASALAENTTGMASTTAHIADISGSAFVGVSNGRVAQCTFAQDTTITITFEYNDMSFNYGLDYAFNMNCSNNPRIDAILKYEGDFKSPQLTFDIDGTADMNLMQDASSKNYLLNGTYSRGGAYNFSGEAQQYNGSREVILTLTNVVLDEETHKIINGTAKVSVTGSTEKGVFSSIADITFQGNNKALVEIAEDSYSLNLESGIVEKK